METKLVGQHLWVGTIGMGAIGFTYILLQICRTVFGRKAGNNDIKEDKGRSRSMSFNSSVFLGGVFPPAAEVRPAIINSLFLFKTCPSNKDLLGAVEKLMTYDRFRNAVKFNGKEWQFVETEVDYCNHIKTVSVKSEKEMMAECDRISQLDLGEYDGVKPLWVFQKVINEGTGLSGLLIRIHHVIGDGISLVNAMSSILTDEDGVPLNMNVPDGKMSQKDSGKDEVREHSPLPSLFQMAKSFLEIVSLPTSRYDTKILFSPNSSNKLRMTKKRKSIVFPTVRLDFIKSLKNKAEVTVNDVLLSILTGAIKRYCANRGDPSMKGAEASKLLNNRCLMPVSLPRPLKQYSDPATALRNFWVMVSVPLPLSPLTARDRLKVCHANTLLVKKSPTAVIQMYLQNLLPKILPQFLQQKTAFDIFSRHTLVFSNVPGPSKLISMCGEQIVGMQILFPNILTNVILISYAGSIYFNMNMDDDDTPGAEEELPKYYLEELTELAKEYGLSTENMLSNLSPEGLLGISTTA